MPSQPSYIPVKVAPISERPGVVGFMKAMVRNPVSVIPPAAYSDPVTILSLPGATIAFICDPGVLEEILIKRVADFPKSQIDERILRPAFGDSLLTAHSESWRWKRRLAAPYFTPSALSRSVPDMIAPFVVLGDTWAASDSTQPRDVVSAMTSATFEVISRTLFSNQDEVDFAEISQAINDYLAPISWVIGLASLKIPDWVPHPGSHQVRKGSTQMRVLVSDLILNRQKKSANSFDDICSELMGARDPESGRPLDNESLVDMLLTLIAAGHETSANGLTWALYGLAEQPQVQEALAAEVADVVGRRPVEAPDLPALKQVEAYLKETMRLFPPVPLLSRQLVERETIGGNLLQPGTILFIPIYAIHRHRQLWEDPDAFVLDRFLGKQAGQISRTAYMPFGAGPRVCVGATFAMMEMVAGLATLLQRVRFSSPGGGRAEPVQRITLRPKGGLELNVEAR